MGRTYTLVNQKGGVGKTTTVINLGAYLAYFGQRVLLIDLDPQANATSCLGVEKQTIRGGTYEALIGTSPAANHILHNPRLKISILPASPALAGAEVELVGEIAREKFLNNALQPLRDRYDYILIDCPPSLGLLTLNGIIAALEGLSQLNLTLDRIRNAVFTDLVVRGVLLTMFDGRTNLSNDVVAEVRRHFGGLVFESVIPRTVRLAEAPSYGQPISVYAPNSNGAEAYASLAREVLIGDGVRLPSLDIETE
jgi:chromosome partitioning protein